MQEFLIIIICRMDFSQIECPGDYLSRGWPTGSNNSRRRRLSSSMTLDPKLTDSYLSIFNSEEFQTLSIPLASTHERVRTLTNDLSEVCGLLEPQTQRALLEDCLWNVDIKSRATVLQDGNPLISFDSPLKPLLHRGNLFIIIIIIL